MSILFLLCSMWLGVLVELAFFNSLNTQDFLFLFLFYKCYYCYPYYSYPWKNIFHVLQLVYLKEKKLLFFKAVQWHIFYKAFIGSSEGNLELPFVSYITCSWSYHKSYRVQLQCFAGLPLFFGLSKTLLLFKLHIVERFN